ncbi:MAG TPA: TlpA disulfide reductase family protein [Rhodocyclaceae bacterium]
MPTLSHFLRAACLMAGIAAASGATALEAGQPAPDYEITSVDGKMFKPAQGKGEVIVLNLWATWCSYCREEMPTLESYYQRHKAEGLRVIAVSMDEADADAKVREIMQAYSFSSGAARLSKLKGFGRIWRLPMTFVIDRNGMLRKDGSEGDPKLDLAVLEREVTPLLQGTVAKR